MRDVVLGAWALVVLATSLGLARIQLFGPDLALLGPYQPGRQGPVPVVELSMAHQLFTRGEALFVDARESERYAEGHIPGAVNADMLPAGALPYSPLLVVYCDGPECGAAMRLAEQLRLTAPGRVAVLADGWPAWQAAGYPSAP